MAWPSALGGRMSFAFSDYVRSLRPDGEPPDPSVFDRLLKKLRGALVYELKKRSLWFSPPSYLGIYGGTHWTDGDLLEELLLDCYLFIFIRRLPGLKKQLESRANIDGLVFLNIRNFLYDAQRRHDPLGFRIYEVLQAAVLRLLERRVLHLLAGDARIRNDTVLGFSAWSEAQAAGAVDLRPQVAIWNNELLPDLITAWSKETVQSRLESLIAGLSDQGVEVFQFQDLIESLKDDARARWQAIRLGSEAVGAPADGDAAGPRAGWVRPDRDFEDRQSFQRLLDCVAEEVEHLAERPKTKDYLRRLWLFFRDWSAEPEAGFAGDSVRDTSNLGERVPSDKKLSELLQIPRGRVPGLKTILGRLVDDCRDRVSGRRKAGEGKSGVYDRGASQGPRSDASSEGSAVMDPKRRREHLRVQTGEAAALFARSAARLAQRRDQPPRPGDTFMFAEVSALPVEWALLGSDEADPRRVLVAPVDDRPYAGSRDVAATDGVAILRCGLATWLDLQAVDPETRAGALEAGVVDRARRKEAEIAAGTLRAKASEQEVDSSPEYQGWIRMLAEARTALPGHPQPASTEVFWERKPSAVVPFRRPGGRPRDAGASSPWKGRRTAYAVAATFALAAVALSWWVGQLRRELSGPMLLPASSGGEIVFRDPDRLPEPLTLNITGSHVNLYLILLRAGDYSAYRVELVRKGDVVWASNEMVGDSEFLLALPRRLLTAGDYRLRLYSRDEAGEERFLEEREVRFVEE